MCRGPIIFKTFFDFMESIAQILKSYLYFSRNEYPNGLLITNSTITYNIFGSVFMEKLKASQCFVGSIISLYSAIECYQ